MLYMIVAYDHRTVPAVSIELSDIQSYLTFSFNLICLSKKYPIPRLERSRHDVPKGHHSSNKECDAVGL